jgi:hypothetical protein
MMNGRTVTTVLAIMTLFTAGRAHATQDDQTAIVLRVDNYAKVPPATLQGAEREASRIYAKLGIDLIWIHSSDDERRVEGAREVRVLLLCSQMSAQKIRQDRISNGVLGVAGHATGRAYVFIPRVMEHSMRFGSPSLVLGRVLAHEVGHLLLSERGHSTRGLMKAHLEPFSHGADEFTEGQRRAIRASFGQ